MALTMINFSAENNQFKGSVDIETQANVEQLGSAAKLVIERKEYGTQQDWVVVFEKDLSAVSDLTNTYSDLTVRPCTKHTYMAIIYASDSSVVEFGSVNVDVFIDGIIVGDFNKQYLAPLSCKTEYTQNTQVNYVTPLASRTPYRVSNSTMNYATGKSSGLFLKFNDDNPVKEQDSSFTQEVVAYLTNGDNKILKTTDGNIWYVSIDNDVDVDFDDNYIGYRIISFNWTEIGDVPVREQV